MCDSVSFFVPGTPVPQGSKNAYVRGGRAVLIEANPKHKTWRTAVTLHARRYTGTMTGKHAIGVKYTFYLPKPKTVRRRLPWVKPDLDKLVRSINDAISDAGVWDDDGRVIALTAEKYYTDPTHPGGVHIHIEKRYTQ